MNEELREQIRNILDNEGRIKNLVLLTYETDQENRETIERVSLVYETKLLNEGFD